MYIIGVAGGSGSGKTTFSKKVFGKLDQKRVAILHLDSYYHSLNPEIKFESQATNFDHPQAFDWELLKNHLLEIKKGKKIDVPLYDFSSCMRLENTRPLYECEILIFEGILALFDPKIRELLDIKCYLSVDSDIRFIRRLHRDVKERDRSIESVIEQYYHTVRPMHQKYIGPQKQYADFIIGEESDIAADILAAKINEVLN